MSNRSLLILALVALGFCTYLYFKGRDPGTHEKEDEATHLVLLDPDKIQRIELTNPSGTFVFQKNGDGKWDMEKPVKFAVDPSAIGAFIAELAENRKERVIDPHKLPDYQAALKKFGLNDPRITARFQTGNEVVDLQVGNKAPSGNLFYALVRDARKQELVVVDDVIESALVQNLDVWRNPQVFDPGHDQPTALLLHRGTQEVEVLKEGGVWNITKPLKEVAVKENIHDFFKLISALRAKSFVSENGSDLAQYGLNSPSAILEVKLGEKSQVLRLGKASADKPDEIYAQFGDRPAIFTISSKQADAIVQLLDELRQREIFNLAMGMKVTAIEIAQGGNTLLLQRKEGGDSEWTVHGDGVERKANPLGATDIIEAMHVMDAKNFYSSVDNPNAEYGLQKPAAVVTVKGIDSSDGGKAFERKVIFGAPKDALVYAQSSVLPFVVDVDRRFLDALPKGAIGWFDRSLAFPPPAEISGLTWRQGASVLSMVKNSDGKWVSDPAGKTIDEKFLNVQLAYLSGLKAVRWTGKAAKKDFISPRFVLEVRAGDKTQKLLLGPKQSDGTSLAKMADDDYAFVLSADDAQKVMVRPVVGEPLLPAAP